ncbi:pyridoxamine 5'-phosphate oxidase family protein [Devosia sp.]|uniref:pyridoxamine 5'-phosphate oxidase family protein n=1 Tax=Devosia sp. TaxID=1871048 RepID=UPI003F6E767C
MANEEHRLSPDELTDKAWHLAEKIRIALLTSWDGEQQRIRPLSANVDRDADVIQFLVGAHGGTTLAQATGAPALTLVEQVKKFPTVTLAFADHGSHDYVTITGQAVVSNDRARIKELWTPFAKAWWDGADDPEIRLLTVTPENAEIWEGPNQLIATAIMLTAAVTGAKPAVGDHGAVRM